MFTNFATGLAVFALSAAALQIQSDPYYAGRRMNTRETPDPADGEVPEGHYSAMEQFSPTYKTYKNYNSNAAVFAFCDLGDEL